MSENKKYYWLKLKENFFDDDTISFIEEQKNGILYVNFYLKLCLKSLKTEGNLIRLVGENLIPYDVNSLARLTNTPIDTVKVAMDLFEKIGLVKIQETGEIYLAQIKEMIGKETDKAELMRRKRAKDKLIGNNVTQMLPECYPEIEKETETEIEKKKDTDVKEIIKYYEENIGLITPATAELLLDYLNDMDYKLIIEAIKIATLANKRNGRYINGILKDWNRKGYKTLLDLENEKQEKEEKEKNTKIDIEERNREFLKKVSEKNDTE